VQRFISASVRNAPVTGILVLVLAVVTPLAAYAQADLTFGPYLGYDRLVLNQPATIGLDITGYVGPIGLRGSAALPRSAFRSNNSSADITDPYDDRLKNWNADGDILLRLIDPKNSGHSAFLYGFAGMGVQDKSAPSTTLDPNYQEVRANWSYGLGLSLPLGPFTMTGEARQRRPFDYEGALSTDLKSTREYRLGFSLHFGGGGGSRHYRPSRHRTASASSSRESTVAAATAVTVLSASSGSSARRVIPTAERYVGVPYKWGGTSPNTGFDCSGFVQYVFARHGVKLPRTSRQMAQVGTYMPPRFSALSPGDLAMFADDGSNISHVAIYAGNGRIIHATSSGGEVRYDDLDSRRGQWFEDHLVAARRIDAVDIDGLLLDLAKGFSKNVTLDWGDNAPRVIRFTR
jgi:cell wall-associated NlpC family hydrolase